MSTRTHLGPIVCVCLKNLFYIFINTKLIKIRRYYYVILRRQRRNFRTKHRVVTVQFGVLRHLWSKHRRSL